ncbi:MAG: hypothetical protein U0R44_00440 [Candidatus Micrarchaeia archaeon]
MNYADRKKKADREHQKDLILLCGGLLLVLICVSAASFLAYQSLILKQPIPEYYLTIFTSLATLTLGYIFGKDKGGG